MQFTPNPKTLIVEGRDEVHVVTNLLRRRKLEQTFEIIDKGGFENLHSSIPTEVKASERRVLGILADANDNIEGRWRSIADQLRKNDCDVPDAICRSGSIFCGPMGIRVGVWLMPNNNSKGELENFIYAMIPDGDPILPRAKEFIDNIPEGERKFKRPKITKAYVHAWLATRSKPRPMGTAIIADDLSHRAEIADSFVTWLDNLFGI